MKIKLANTGDAGSFTGLAATFGPLPDRQGEVIDRRAFDDTIAEWAARGFAVPLLLQHDQYQPIGSITAARVTAEGLAVEGRIAVNTTAGAEAYALAQTGALSMSIGFTAEPSAIRRDARGIVHLLAVDLHEVSLVSVPANADARITAIKSAYQAQTIREFESMAREALGLSSRDAKAVAAKSWPIVSRREDGRGRRDGAPDVIAQKALAILAASNPHSR